MADKNTNLLVTGANGFIGTSLCDVAEKEGFRVTRVTRRKTGINHMVMGDISPETDWSPVLNETEIIVYLVARVYIKNDPASDPLDEYRKINVRSCLNLARQAARQGVRRFVFLSTVKVNGEATENGQCFTPDDEPEPADPYALSKYEAEQGLLDLAGKTGMEVVIIRPPLVYGPGVKGNFATLVKWVNSGIPLPLGKIENRRSLIALDNLVSFILCCLVHERAANQIFLLSDNEDVSTTTLLRRVARAYGKKPLLISFPVNIMKTFARLAGRKDFSDRLFQSLVVDSSKAFELLGWKPVISMKEQLSKMARIRSGS